MVPPAAARSVSMPIYLKICLQHIQWIAAISNLQSSHRTQDVDLPPSRSSYQQVNEDVDVTQGVDTGTEYSTTVDDDESRYFVESCTTSQFELIRRKGVYPYDYMDSVDKFEETSLPSQDVFFNKLSGNPCSDSGYAHATRVWDAFGCQTIADYLDVYLQLDVLLLADFSEIFRQTFLEF